MDTPSVYGNGAKLQHIRNMLAVYAIIRICAVDKDKQ